MALLVGRDLLKPLEGTHIRAALDSALAKMTGASLSVRLGPHKTYREHRETVDQLMQAIAERRTVQMRYFSASQRRSSRREVDPYHVWYADGGLYLAAYDHRRREVRTFAVERVRTLTTTDHPYQLPFSFDIDDYVKDARHAR
jgi:predicted DNA-binding transcriptional regulator YafY